MLVKSLNGVESKFDDSENKLIIARTEIESLSSKLKEAEKEINH